MATKMRYPNVRDYEQELPYDAWDVTVNEKEQTIRWKEDAAEDDDATYFQFLLEVPSQHLEWTARGRNVSCCVGGCYEAGLDTTEKFRYALECFSDHHGRNWA